MPWIAHQSIRPSYPGMFGKRPALHLVDHELFADLEDFANLFIQHMVVLPNWWNTGISNLFRPWAATVDLHRGWILEGQGTLKKPKAVLRHVNGFSHLDAMDELGVRGYVKLEVAFFHLWHEDFDGMQIAHHVARLYFTDKPSALMFKLAYGGRI